MKRALVTLLAALLVLVIALPASAAPDTKDDIKLRVFVHYPKGVDGARPASVCDIVTTDSSNYLSAGWKIAATEYRVNYATIPSSVTNASLAIRNSFATWQAASGVALTEGSPTRATRATLDGQNVVVWGNAPSGAIAVTYTWSNQASGLVVEVDTVMNRKLPWAFTQAAQPDRTCAKANAYDVQNILTHEVGHWMGLGDLYNQVDNDLTMFGYGALDELKKDTLLTGDLAGIAHIYK
jgi:hypothetical protein